MNSRPEKKSSKPVFAQISPKMSREQMKRNIMDALKKSGITVKQGIGIVADEEGGDE